MFFLVAKSAMLSTIANCTPKSINWVAKNNPLDN